MGLAPKCHFVLGLPSESSKIPTLGTSIILGPITLHVDLRLKWDLKQSYSSCWELFNNISHVTYTQGNRGDSRLLMVESQVVILAPDLSFGHNLCLKCPNGSCEPILNIYVPKKFQWYNELFNTMGFDRYNRFLKIWKSIEIPIPKMGAHLGV